MVQLLGADPRPNRGKKRASGKDAAFFVNLDTRLLPKSDIPAALANVRFVPITDIASFVIDAGEQSRWNAVAEHWRRR